MVFYFWPLLSAADGNRNIEESYLPISEGLLVHLDISEERRRFLNFRFEKHTNFEPDSWSPFNMVMVVSIYEIKVGGADYPHDQTKFYYLWFNTSLVTQPPIRTRKGVW